MTEAPETSTGCLTLLSNEKQWAITSLFQIIHDLHVPVTFPQLSVLLAVPFNSVLHTNSSSVLAVLLALSKTFLVWEGTLRRGQLYTDGSSGTSLTQSFFCFPVQFPKSCLPLWPLHSWELRASTATKDLLPECQHQCTAGELNCHFIAYCSKSWNLSGAPPSWEYATVLMTPYCQQTITWLSTCFLRLAWICWIAE